jgi:hypothetical protein
MTFKKTANHILFIIGASLRKNSTNHDADLVFTCVPVSFLWKNGACLGRQSCRPSRGRLFVKGCNDALFVEGMFTGDLDLTSCRKDSASWRVDNESKTVALCFTLASHTFELVAPAGDKT